MKGFAVISGYIEYDGERFAKITDDRILDRCQWHLENNVEPQNSEKKYYRYTDDDEIDDAKETAESNERNRIVAIIKKLGDESELDSDDVKTIIARICS